MAWLLRILCVRNIRFCTAIVAAAAVCLVSCLPAHHRSRRTIGDTNETLWAIFLLSVSGRRVYYTGDSGYFVGYREIGRRYPGIDYALMPVTAYDPRWFMRNVHMDAKEALL